MKDKNYPLCLHIQPMDGITYRESLLAFYAVIQDLEKGLGKPMEEIESGYYDYRLQKDTTIQMKINKRSIRVAVLRTSRLINSLNYED